MAGWNVVDESDVLRVLRQGGAVRLEMSRPESLNALNDTLAIDLRDALLRLGGDHSVRCLVLTGRGRAFSAGADIKGGQRDSGDGRGDRTRRVLREHINPAIRAIREMPKPVIAAVNGPAVGVGCSFAVACGGAIGSDAVKT